MTHTHDDGNAKDIAIKLFAELTEGITIPSAPDFSGDKFSFETGDNNPLYETPSPIKLEDVTEGTLDGEGAFDKFMDAMDAHLKREYKGNRITGDQYAKVYSEVMTSMMSNATGFILQKDQAKWAAITAQMQARIAEIQATKEMVELERIKFETLKALFDMQQAGAGFALTKMQIATEDAKHCSVRSDNALKDYELKFALPAEVAVKQYERTALLPSQVAMNNVQVDRILPAQATQAEYQNRVLLPIEKDIQELQRDRILTHQAEEIEFKVDNLLPLELQGQQHLVNIRQPRESELLQEQIEVQNAQTRDKRTDGVTDITGILGRQADNLQADYDTKTYVLGNQIPKQVELVGKQVQLTGEQVEAERAKTLDARTDGQIVEGSVGKQKDLYDQQIDSFIKDAKHKTAKMYLDGWITQKTLDEGLNAPSQLTNNEINEVLTAVRQANNLGS